MKVPWGHVIGVCQLGNGPDECRYLLSTSGGWYCGKRVTYLKRRIDTSAEREEQTSLGDNCPGWGAEET